MASQHLIASPYDATSEADIPPTIRGESRVLLPSPRGEAWLALPLLGSMEGQSLLADH